MANTIVVNAEVRSETGKGAARRLRRAGQRVPGVLYGGGEESVALTVDDRDLAKAMQEEAFFSQILEVNLPGQSSRAVLRDLQRHPASEKVTHIDFMRIREDVPIQINVPLHFINEDKCVGVKLGGGTIAHNLIEVEISCLPKDLPEFIEVDMESVELGFAIHLSGLSLPPGVTVVALTHGADHDIPVVAVTATRVSVEPTEEAPEAAEEAADAEDAQDEGGGAEE